METFPKLWTVATKFDLYQRDCNLLSFLRNNVELFAKNENIQLLTEAEMALFIECVNDPSTSTRHNVIAKCIFNWKCDKKCREAPAVRLFKKIRVDHLDEETVYQLLELNHNVIDLTTAFDASDEQHLLNVPRKHNAQTVFVSDTTMRGAKMEEKRQQKSGTDVIIQCKDGSVHAHKLVLTTSCAYFESLFETNSLEVNFSTVKKDVIEAIVQYLYAAQLPKNDYDFLTEMISTCHLMQIIGLFDHCWTELMDGISREHFLNCSHDYLIFADVIAPLKDQIIREGSAFVTAP
uniref:BTB domain-containing protein n=1 Tax=Strigamia maritima TaxID=126957 RepID=T1IXJ2_STRMM